MGVCRFDALETRRLFAFSTLDPTYAGTAGVFGQGNEAYPETIVPISDGGVILQRSDGALTRLDANGNVIRKFGSNGVYSNAQSFGTSLAQQFAADRATGGIAFVRSTKVGEDVNQSPIYKHDLYVGSSLAKKIRLASTDLPDFGPHGNVSIQFDSRSRLLVSVFTGSTHQLFRLAPGGQAIDTSFGVNGSITVVGGALNFHVGPDDSISFFNQTSVNVAGDRTHMMLDVVRYNANGQLSTKFSGDGKTSILIGSVSDDGYESVDRADVAAAAVAPDGSMLFVLQRTRYGPDVPSQQSALELLRIRSNGKRDAIVQLPLEYGSAASATVSLHIDSSSAYLVSSVLRSGDISMTNAARVIRFDYQTAALGTAFNGNDGARLANGMTVSASVLDVNGRLLLSGARGTVDGRDAIGVFAAATGSANLASMETGTRLQSNGTLLIQGSAGADVIVARVRFGKVEVKVNGVFTTFATYAVTSILIHGGDGNDRISIYASTRGALIDGGAGNDTIIGSDGADVLKGGAGDDSITARSGADEVYGQAGNDTLEGDDGRDRLFGEAGNDHVYALDAAGTPEVNAIDTLFGGAGADRIVRSGILAPETEQFEWTDADGEDVLI